MGKSRNKNRSEIESLKGEIRRLQKLLKQANKHIREQDLDLNVPEEPIVVHTTANCPECHKGELKLILNLGFKEIYECNSCEFRKSVNV